MPADWQIRHWPRCAFHVFLSHCAEDRESLVLPVYRGLQELGITAWIDRHDYPQGRDPFEVLREELLRCRHVVYFLTLAALRQGRGWTAVELGYGAVVQQSLRFNTLDVAHFKLPLFLCNHENDRLPRTIWRTLFDKGRFQGVKRSSRKSQIRWCLQQISEFLRAEQLWGQQIGERIQQDPELQAFAGDRNLFRRIIAADPPPIPLD